MHKERLSCHWQNVTICKLYQGLTTYIHHLLKHLWLWSRFFISKDALDWSLHHSVLKCLIPGIVIYVSPVKEFATRIKFILSVKKMWITWLFPSEVLDYLIFSGSKVKLQPCVFDTLQFGGYLDPLIGLQKRPWLLDSILIPVTNTCTLLICKDKMVATPP